MRRQESSTEAFKNSVPQPDLAKRLEARGAHKLTPVELPFLSLLGPSPRDHPNHGGWLRKEKAPYPSQDWGFFVLRGTSILPLVRQDRDFWVGGEEFLEASRL